MLQLTFLGQFDVAYDGRRLAIPTRNAQTLLAFLALTAGQSHRREKLAGMLWPDSVEESARSNLRHELWRLRKALEPTEKDYLLSDDLSIAFNPHSDYSLDTRQLEASPVDAESTDKLITAASLYGGDLLPGFYNEWVLLERDRLRSAYESRLARLLELLEVEGRWVELQDWANRWIAAGEWPEPAWRALILSYANTGDIPRAVSTYERFSHQLQSELGLEPSTQTQALYEHIRNGWKVTASDLATTTTYIVPAPSSAPQLHDIHTNLPRPLTGFIGRQAEIEQVNTLMKESRLVTIVGPGGVGKTRLAIQTASEMESDFIDGVWWGELAAISVGVLSTEEAVLQAIAKAVRLPNASGGSVKADLIEHMRDRHLLLILDNCEHLINTCAELAETLLEEIPGLSILATSREPLRIPGERVMALPSLSLRNTSQIVDGEVSETSEAERLFLLRAADVHPHYAPTETDLQAIAQICARLDGIPLAIELAAARLNLLSAEEIAARLDSLFSLLTSGSRTALPRHQTLRAAIEWSYDLLSSEEQALFRRLSAFTGCFTLEAVEAVCAINEVAAVEVLTLMGRLKDKSLLHIDHVTRDTPGTRYRLLDTMATYGRLQMDRAGETQQLHHRHANYYMQFVERAEPELSWKDQAPWFHLLLVEYDNIRAALDWCIENDEGELALRLLAPLTWFWNSTHSVREGVSLSRRILALPTAASPSPWRAKLLNSIAYLQWVMGDVPATRTSLDEALAILQTIDDPGGLAWASQLRAIVYSSEGQYELAEAYMQDGVELARTLKQHESTLTLGLWGDIALNEGDYERAVTIYTKSVAVIRTLDNYLILAYPVRRLGYLALEAGDLGQAWQHFRESFSLNQKIGDRRGTISCLIGMVALTTKMGQLAVAVQLYGLVEHHLESLYNLMPLDQIELAKVRSEMAAALDEEAREAALNAGRVLTEEQALALVEAIFASSGPAAEARNQPSV